MNRKLWSIEGNSQRLDGGAMFGNAPRALWQRWATADAQHRIPLACRAMLVQEPGRNILFEAGIGVFFPPEMRQRFGVQEEEHRLIESLSSIGLSPEDIDVIVLSHLHFDHAGGLLLPYREGQSPALAFRKAQFVVGATAFARAKSPHARDRASFIPELPGLLEASGRLEAVQGERSEVLGPDYRLHFAEGHTPGLLMAEVPSRQGPIVYASDLIPGAPWVHVPITMGYDRYPEQLIDEKRALLEDLLAREGRLFFVHDPEVALGTLVRDGRDRFSVERTQARVEGLVL